MISCVCNTCHPFGREQETLLSRKFPFILSFSKPFSVSFLPSSSFTSEEEKGLFLSFLLLAR